MQLALNPDGGRPNTGGSGSVSSYIERHTRNLGYGQTFENPFGADLTKTANAVVSIPENLGNHRLDLANAKTVLRDSLNTAGLGGTLGTIIPGIGNAIGSVIGFATGLIAALTRENTITVHEFLQSGLYGLFEAGKGKLPGDIIEVYQNASGIQGFTEIYTSNSAFNAVNQYKAAVVEFSGTKIVKNEAQELNVQMLSVLLKNYSDAIIEQSSGFKGSNDISDVTNALAKMRIDTDEGFASLSGYRPLLHCVGSPVYPFQGGTVSKLYQGASSQSENSQAINSKILIPLAIIGIVLAVS